MELGRSRGRPFPRLSYQLLPVLIEGGHKTGHSRVVRHGEPRRRGQARGAAGFFYFWFFSFPDRSLTRSERAENYDSG
jgi:hypothetical protein